MKKYMFALLGLLMSFFLSEHATAKMSRPETAGHRAGSAIQISLDGLGPEQIMARHPERVALMHDAFAAAFGMPAPITNRPDDDTQVDVQVNPQALFQAFPGLWVLVSTYKFNGGHYAEGRLLVDYLTSIRGRFRVVSRGFGIEGGSGFGQTADWVLRFDIDHTPAIWTSYRWAGMGVTGERHDLIELLPTKPMQVASVNLASTYTPLGEEPHEPPYEKACKITGRLEWRPGRIEVIYYGTRSGRYSLNKDLDGRYTEGFEPRSDANRSDRSRCEYDPKSTWRPEIRRSAKLDVIH